MNTDIKERSKGSFAAENLTYEAISAGCMQRIADAAEQMAISSGKMAGNYIKLQADLDMYKRWYQEGRESNQKMGRTISTLRGVITKQKNKLAAIKPNK